MSIEPSPKQLHESLRQSENSRLALLRENDAYSKRLSIVKIALLKTENECKEAMRYGRGLTKERTAHVAARCEKVLRKEPA